jgi:hypothetical protein
MLHTFFYVILVLLVVIGLGTLGFVITPRPFRKHPAPSRAGQPVRFRPDLPEPVRRHFSETIGDNPPQIDTAVIWGRGRACIRGLWVPFRFKGWYKAGDAFLRRMEFTWFQRPVLRGIDSLINGQGVFEMGEKVETGERIDQGEVLTLWSDTVWLPSIFVHDQRIQWRTVDDQTVEATVPYQSTFESLMMHFDPLSHRMTHLTALRFSDEDDSTSVAEAKAE